MASDSGEEEGMSEEDAGKKLLPVQIHVGHSTDMVYAFFRASFQLH